MILIIAEKPSLARNIVSGIGKMNRKDGYFENENYLVTWAFGHLFTLYDIEDYDNLEDRKWKMDNLPFYPKEFKFNLKKDQRKHIDDGVLKQFNIIKALVNREDVDTIVNAGDSDREGEIIVRLCINNALNSEKKLVRLWLPDQTEETVKKALTEMKDEKEYDNLANEGFARTYVDWLYGVNLTRYATLKTGTLLRVGRVIVPIVKAIYDRDKQIEEFVPDIYYGIASNEETNGEVVELNSKEKFDKEKLEDAKKLCELYNKEKAVVTKKTVKKDTPKNIKSYVRNTTIENTMKEYMENNPSEYMQQYGFTIEPDSKIVNETNQFSYTEYRMSAKIKHKFGTIKIYAQDVFLDGVYQFTECFLL